MLSHGLRDLVAVLKLFPDRYRIIKQGIILGFLSGIFIVAGYACAAFAFTVLMQNDSVAAGSGYPLRLLWWLAAGLLLLLAGFYCRGKAGDTNHAALFQLEVDLRESLAQKVAQIPLGAVHNQGTGTLKKIIFDDVKALHTAIADASPFIGVVFAQPLTALIILLLVQWKLFLVVCVMLVIVQLCMKLMTRDFVPQEQRYNQATENTNLAVIEFVQGMPVVRTFDNNQVAWKRYTSRIHEFTAAVSDWMQATRRASLLNDIFTNSLPTFLALVVVSVILFIYQQISLSDMILGLMIGILPIQAFKPFSIMIHLLFYSRASARRILSLFAIESSAEPAQPILPQRFDIQFDQVNFAYNDERQILRNISFSLQQGQRCALVGASGCGKSTISRLIARFYDNYSGTICIGGVDIRQITSTDLLRRIAFIFQEPFLTADSIAENIRLYQPDATQQQVEQAAQAVNLHEFILTLPQGYNSPVGEKGTRLSGGQRQRITIARALLSEAQIIVLDEATASVDPENEAEIVQSLARLTEGKTVITIAHRLATIINCDNIIVLNKGEIAGTGRHQELLTHCSHYASLWQNYYKATDWTLTKNSAAGDVSC